MQSKKWFESGRSMIEMVGVLAIMGLLTGGAFVLIKSGLVSQKISRVSDEIDILASSVGTMMAQSDSFSGLPTAIDKGQNLAKMILKSDGVSPFGGNYYVIYKALAGTNNKCKKVLTIGINNMTNASDCTEMKKRSYSGANFCEAVCNTKTLEIYYTKTK